MHEITSVQCVSDYDIHELNAKINEIVQTPNKRVVDIQYSTCVSSPRNICYSALVIFGRNF